MNEKLHLIQHRHAKQLKKYSALNMFSCQQPPTSEPSEPLRDTTLITMNTNTALYFDSVPQTQILTTAPNADWFTAEKRKGRIGSYLRDTWLKDTGLADSFLLKLQIQHECLKQDAPNQMWACTLRKPNTKTSVQSHYVQSRPTFTAHAASSS